VLSTLVVSTLGVVTVTVADESVVSFCSSVVVGAVQAKAVIKTTKKTKIVFIVLVKFFLMNEMFYKECKTVCAT
jgi:hypothetical protein